MEMEWFFWNHFFKDMNVTYRISIHEPKCGWFLHSLLLNIIPTSILSTLNIIEILCRLEDFCSGSCQVLGNRVSGVGGQCVRHIMLLLLHVLTQSFGTFRSEICCCCTMIFAGILLQHSLALSSGSSFSPVLLPILPPSHDANVPPKLLYPCVSNLGNLFLAYHWRNENIEIYFLLLLRYSSMSIYVCPQNCFCPSFIALKSSNEW